MILYLTFRYDDEIDQLQDADHSQSSKNDELVESSYSEGFDFNLSPSISSNTLEQEPHTSENSHKYEKIDYIAGLLSLFFATSMPQCHFKSVCDFMKIFNSEIMSDFDQCSNYLLRQMGVSLDYTRKVYCAECKVNYQFEKTVTRCIECGNK
jgi:hypothetical protein